MKRIPDLWWNMVGYGLWAVGCLLFAVAAARDGDVVSLLAGLLFLVGVLVVIGPMARASRATERRPAEPAAPQLPETMEPTVPKASSAGCVPTSGRPA